MNVMADNADLGTLDWQTRLRAGMARSHGIDVTAPRTHPLSYEHKSPRDVAVSRGVGQLTDGQRDCLRLVYDHMTSKDIARVLGISPHTVDMRIRNALKTLGVSSRIEAARALVEAEGQGAATANSYRPLIYQAPDVAVGGVTGTVTVPASTTSDEYATQHSDPRFSPDFGPPASGPPRLAGASLPFVGNPLGTGSVAKGKADGRNVETPLAGSLPWGARNTLSPGARLAWVAMIAIGSSLGFGAILGALEALKKLL